MAMLLGSASGNHQLFVDYMEIANRYSSVDELLDAAEAVRAQATLEEKTSMLRGHGVVPGVLPIDLLLWAMKEADSANPGQRQHWVAHHTRFLDVEGGDKVQVVQAPVQQAAPIVVLDTDNEEMEDVAPPAQVPPRRSARLPSQKPSQDE